MTKFKAWLDAHRGGVAEIADKLGVSDKAVYGWAAGTFRPSLANAVKLEVVTGGAVRVADWLGGDDGAGGSVAEAGDHRVERGDPAA